MVLMRISWPQFRERALVILRDSRTANEARVRISALVESPITGAQLDAIYRRWAQTLGLPPTLGAIYGTGRMPDSPVSHPQPSPAIDAISNHSVYIPAPNLIVPKEARPPEPPPADALFIHPGDIPSGVFSDGDNHYGATDRVVEAAKIAWLRDVRPPVHVNVGDQYDAFGLSRYEKPAGKLLSSESTLLSEFRDASSYWQAVGEVCSESHLILGNHERRLEALVNANPALFGLLDWSRLANLPSSVRVHSYGSRVRIGAVTWEHGDRVGGRFGILHPSYWLLANKGHRSTIFGHTHRIESRQKTVYDESLSPHIYGAWNQGHGSSVADAWKWCPDPNWQHGFSYVENYTIAGKARFTVHQITIIDGRFSWGGKLYDGRKCM